MHKFHLTWSNAFILVLTSIFTRIIYLLYFHPLSKYPGPLIAKLTNTWRFIDYFRGTQHTTDASLHEKYGPVVRIGPDYLLFAGIDAYQSIYGFKTKIEKGHFYDMAGDPHNRLVFQAHTAEEHRLLKGRLAPVAFNAKKIAEYEGVLARNVALFMEKLGKMVGGAEGTVDVSQPVRWLTGDAITEIIWGSPPPGFLMAGNDKQGILKAKEQFTQLAFGIPLLPWLVKILTSKPVFTRVRDMRDLDKSGQPVGVTALMVVLKSHFAKVASPENVKDGPSIVQTLLTVRDDDKRKIESKEAIFNDGVNFTFAGQGTTASSITTALYDLGRHPNWAQRIHAEISALPPAQHHPALWQLPTLQAFLRESWRLAPPIIGANERVIGKGGETSISSVKGTLPAGTRVTSNLYVILRSKDVFGEDADEFSPERWLTGDEERRKAMEDSWGVYGRGSRACIGKDVALILACMVIAEVLTKWNLKCEPDGMKRKNNWELHYEKMSVTLTARETK